MAIKRAFTVLFSFNKQFFMEFCVERWSRKLWSLGEIVDKKGGKYWKFLDVGILFASQGG